MTHPFLVKQLKRALTVEQSPTLIDILVEDIQQTLAWVEVVEVDEAPEQHYARLVVCHSYPEGITIQSHVRAIVDKHHRPKHIGIGIEYRRVKPGYESEK